MTVDVLRGMSPERRRLTLGLLVSLLIHALLLTLTFSGQGLGRPGFSLPWQDRRIEAPEILVAILPAPAPAAEPVQNAPKAVLEQTDAAEPSMLTVVSRAPPAPSTLPEPPAKSRETARVSPVQPKKRVKPKTAEAAPTSLAQAAAPGPAAEISAVERSDDSAPAPTPAAVSTEIPPVTPIQDVMAVAQSNQATWTVPLAPEITAEPIPEIPEITAIPPPVTAVAPTAPSPQIAVPSPSPRDDVDAKQERAHELAELDRARQGAQRQAQQVEAERQEIAKQTAARQDAARWEAARQEAARAEAAQAQAVRQLAARKDAARQEAAHQEAARAEAERSEASRQQAERRAAAQQEAAQQEVARQDTARQAVARAETTRIESERQDTARQAAVRQEAARQDAGRQEAARAEAARIEAAHQEGERQTAARQEAVRQDTARQEAARAEAARLAAKQAEADKREERLRAIGRQLNEEADRREAREAAALRSTSASTLRRGRLYGRADANAELILYAEAWSRKIQLNMTFDMIREAVKQPHTDPLVTVAIRSDGSVEAITFVRSSGVPAIDEAIRRIVQSQANYPAFSPALLSDYDVIEIRRTWHFDMAVRLY